MNLTSMNGERRMRLTERYMDPPGESQPDCLIAARLANAMERVLREMGDAKYADQFKGFDWKTEEDAFMDGYAKHEKGGQFVTYARLRAMGTNGFQEPAVDFKDNKIVGTKRLYADGKFGTKEGKATFFKRNGGGCRRLARKSRRRSSSISSTTVARIMCGRTPISIRTTSSSWTGGLIRSSR
jgi:arsenite oxidase large subunit